MKKWIIILMMAACTAWAFDQSAALEFVQKTADDVITNVLTTKDSEAVKAKKFEDTFIKALDIPYIAKFVLGRYWKTASHTDKTDFVEAFKIMLIRSWSEKFALYKGQKIEFFDVTPAPNKNQYFVNSKIQDGANPIVVLWRLLDKDGQYKIIDVVIEGVHMATSYRNEYTAYLQNHTLEELIEALKNPPEKKD